MINILIVIFCVVCGASAKINSNEGVIMQVRSIYQFIVENPEVSLIQMDEYKNVDESKTYYLGQRQTGDVVVANASDQKKWPTSQNVTTTLSYPSTGGNGAFLTYILINCEQSSNNGRGFVTSGGVKQHSIQIVIETPFTTYFNYAAMFYGIK